MPAKLIARGNSVSVKESISGVVRIILNPETGGSGFSPGDILVVKTTDASYFPFMLQSSAMVGEIGGLASHLATVARELNKIAVVGVTGITALVQDGDTIVVNGKTGEIHRA